MFAIPDFDPRRFFDAATARALPAVAASACLAGEAVRYDGASKDCALLRDWSAQLRVVAICPEVGAGLGVPRPPVQLVASDRDGAPQARGRDDASLDVTAPLQHFARGAAARLLAEPDLCGYVWKSRSPSCGLDSTPLFDAAGAQLGVTRGIQARHVVAALPWLVHREETRLQRAPEAARFLLQCRLVFEARALLSRQPGRLPDWHRHYQFMRPLLPDPAAGELQRCAQRRDWRNYLARLNRALENVEAEQLLGLFAAANGGA